MKADLYAGREVLFSGTSCQVDGLKKFLSTECVKNLICVDIVCHGVPSPLVWKNIWHGRRKKPEQRLPVWILEIKKIMVGVIIQRH